MILFYHAQSSVTFKIKNLSQKCVDVLAHTNFDQGEKSKNKLKSFLKSCAGQINSKSVHYHGNLENYISMTEICGRSDSHFFRPEWKKKTQIVFEELCGSNQ